VIIADVVIVVHAIPLIVAHGIRKDAVILPPIKEQKPTFPQNHSPPKNRSFATNAANRPRRPREPTGASIVRMNTSLGCTTPMRRLGLNQLSSVLLLTTNPMKYFEVIP